MKKSALISLLMLIIYLITLPSCQTNQPFSLGMNTDGDLEISYLSGQLTFVDELPNQKIYTDEYPEDIFTPDMVTSYSNSYIGHTMEGHLYTVDESEEILNLCCDPACDHSVEGSCVSSYGGSYFIQTSNEVFFCSGPAVFRYSKDTFTTELYANFNTQPMTLFVMGRYLYIQTNYTQFLKVDMTTNEAMVLSLDAKYAYGQIRPLDGYLYLMTNVGVKEYGYESGYVLYRSDPNFREVQLLVKNIGSTLSMHIVGDKLYHLFRTIDFTDLASPVQLSSELQIRDAATGELLDTVPDIECFGISGDTLYAQKFDPSSTTVMVRDTITTAQPPLDPTQAAPQPKLGEEHPAGTPTGNKIYSAPLSNPHALTLFTEVKYDKALLQGSQFWITEKYLHSLVLIADEDGRYDHFSYRMNLGTKKWQLVANGPYRWGRLLDVVAPESF